MRFLSSGFKINSNSHELIFYLQPSNSLSWTGWGSY